MSNYEKHAMEEFRAAGWVDENGKYNDEMQELICNHVLKLLEVFHGEGHSGSTAPYTIDLFSRLAYFKPVAPLTGEDWEWIKHDYGAEPTYQNKRCSSVFKDADGSTYNIDGKVFWEWQKFEGESVKSYYTCRESRVPVTFPYTVPKEPEYVYRYSDADPPAPPQTEAGLL